MGCGLLSVMHFLWNMPEQVAFQVDAMSRVIQNNFNMLRIEMRVTGTESLGARALGRKCTDLAMNELFQDFGFFMIPCANMTLK